MSKYCSPQHTRLFAFRMVEKRLPDGKDDQTNVRGWDALTKGQLATLAASVTGASAFRVLGTNIFHPPPPQGPLATSMRMVARAMMGSTTTPSTLPVMLTPVGLTMLTEREKRQFEDIERRWWAVLEHKPRMHDWERFVELTTQRAARLQQPSNGLPAQEFCGFDWRLSWSWEQFQLWRSTEAGARALAEGNLLPLPGPERSSDVKDWPLCMTVRCQCHKRWRELERQGAQLNWRSATQTLIAIQREALELRGLAAIRHAKDQDGPTGGFVEQVGEE